MPCRRSARLSSPLDQEAATFHLVQASPDAMTFTRRERELAALLPNRAARTERLGDRLARVLLLSAFEVVRGKEVHGILAAARGLVLPALDDVPHLI